MSELSEEKAEDTPSEEMPERPEHLEYDEYVSDDEPDYDAEEQNPKISGGES